MQLVFNHYSVLTSLFDSNIQSTLSYKNTLENWKNCPLVELSAYGNYFHKKKWEK